MEIQAYSLEPSQIEIVKRVAAEHKSNRSAALRFIIEDWNTGKTKLENRLLKLQAVFDQEVN